MSCNNLLSDDLSEKRKRVGNLLGLVGDGQLFFGVGCKWVAILDKPSAASAPHGRVEAMGERDEALGRRDEALGGRDEALGGNDEALGGRVEALGGRNESLVWRDNL